MDEQKNSDNSRNFTVTGIPVALFIWIEREAKNKGIAISSFIKTTMSDAKDIKAKG